MSQHSVTLDKIALEDWQAIHTWACLDMWAKKGDDGGCAVSKSLITR
jgi:hypothetical protein